MLLAAKHPTPGAQDLQLLRSIFFAGYALHWFIVGRFTFLAFGVTNEVLLDQTGEALDLSAVRILELHSVLLRKHVVVLD